MHGLPSFHRFITRIPIRRRLALVSFGLLALLLAALGMLISITEEQALLASQANVLISKAQLIQMQLQIAKVAPTAPQILTFSAMSKDTASALASGARPILGQDVGISLLAFDGSILATARSSKVPTIEKSLASQDSNLPAVTLPPPNLPIVTLPPSTVQQWLKADPPPSYLLAKDNREQRELVILQPIAMFDKSTGINNPQEPLSGYRKALLQLSMPTTAIDQSVATTRLILTLGILAALGIAAALTLPLINIALRPLVEMEKVSSRIAAGALSLRLAEPPAQDEIGQLARSFNSMVASLEAAFTQQKRFVADVSHELRTPLTGLSGSLEMLLLRADNGDEETSRHLMSGMYTEVERMQRLVTDLLALTRLDEGRIQLHVEAVEVSPLLNEVCEQMQGLVHGQELSYQVPLDLPPLRGDSDQLRRILLNIVENALKFTPPTGRVELIAYSECTEFVTLEARDTGIGILPEALPHVFDRFYRADSSRTRLSLKVGGSGLGLSIAKELVEMHGGTIAISSTVGQGTTVTIRLPALTTPLS